MKDILRALTINPARIAGICRGALAKGAVADLVIFDPKFETTIDPTRFFSKGRNTPFGGMRCRGKVRKTIVGGKIAYSG